MITVLVLRVVVIQSYVIILFAFS